MATHLSAMRWSRLALILHCAVLFCTASAQQSGIVRYDLDQGLPQSLVNHVIQDRDGFIWFGTGDGLARFDGTRFVVYKHDPRDSTSITDNSIWGLAEADANNLWVGTRSGLDRLDRRTGRFEHMRIGARDGRNGCWQPLTISTDRSTFYSPLTRELLVIDGNGHQRKPTRHQDTYCKRVSADGRTFWTIEYPDTLLATDLITGEEHWQSIPVDPGDRVLDMLPFGERWLFLTRRGGWIMESDGQRTELPPALRDRLHAAGERKYLQQAADGAVWIALSGYGVLVLDQGDLSIKRTYPLVATESTSLSVSAVYMDHQGNCWVGTDGLGVFMIAPQRIKFDRVGPGMQLPWEPPSWFVRSFAQWDEHRVLIALHEGGLALFDERTQQLSPFTIPGRIATNTFARMATDAYGLVWLKDEQGIMALDPASGGIVYAPPNSTSATFLRDSANRMSLVQDRAFIPLRYTAGSMVLGERTRHALLDSLGGRVERIAVDPKGHWWGSAHEMAVSVWDSHGRIPIVGAQPHNAMRMMNLVPIDRDRAWMATSDGLLRWSLDPPAIEKHYTIHDGLPDQFTYGVVEDVDGAWWVSSNNGLSRFDPGTEHFRNYTTAHGLQSREFNANAFLRTRGGRIYFGGVNGFNHFKAGGVADDPDPARVQIVAITDRNGPVLQREGEPITLPWPRNELGIELAVLEFSAPEANRAKWRLRGYDDAWRIISPATPIELGNLPDGDFVLEAIGINGDGVEGMPTDLLRIAVKRPFWANTWFVVFVTVIIIGLLAWLWARASRRRMQRKLAESERELRELRLRTRLAKDIHDDVGSGLARMAALSRSSKREADAPERFDKLAGISGELLDNLRDVVWMNDPRHDTLDAVLLRIHDHAHDLFEEGGASVHADFPDPLPAHTVDGAFRRNLYLIAKEALHNARKYSGARRITLRWKDDGAEFIFEVADDGRGITRAAPQGSGHGSENMRQRADEMGARFERVNATDGGTVVRVQGRSCRP